jgi:hypothetical protein
MSLPQKNSNKTIINDYSFYFLMCIRIENWNKIKKVPLPYPGMGSNETFNFFLKEPYSLAQQQVLWNIEHSPMETPL